MPKLNLGKAIADFKKGKIVIVIDDKHRENEADFVLAAQYATPEKINFMIKQGRGLICIPMLGKRLDELKIPLMTKNNTEVHKSAFTMSVDAKKGVSTGISAYDRARTIKALINKNLKSSDFARPGHIFPLRCEEEGLKKRPGHTEASIEMCKLARLYPAAVICEIVGKSGRMAKMPELKQIAKKFDLSIIKIKELTKHLSIKTFKSLNFC